MPSGFPDTVSRDYKEYQIWDSIQVSAVPLRLCTWPAANVLWRLFFRTCARLGLRKQHYWDAGYAGSADGRRSRRPDGIRVGCHHNLDLERYNAWEPFWQDENGREVIELSCFQCKLQTFNSTTASLGL